MITVRRVSLRTVCVCSPAHATGTRYCGSYFCLDKLSESVQMERCSGTTEASSLKRHRSLSGSQPMCRGLWGAALTITAATITTATEYIIICVCVSLYFWCVCASMRWYGVHMVCVSAFTIAIDYFCCCCGRCWYQGDVAVNVIFCKVSR